ncbi:MAG: lipopolysaccharide exporter [Candidatus Azotimanducaceae bacterium]
MAFRQFEIPPAVSHVSFLVIGTLIGQILVFMGLPILSRMYEVADFGRLGIFVAISTIFSLMFTIRFELAILIPRLTVAAANIFYLCHLSALTLFVLFSLTYFLFQSFIEMESIYYGVLVSALLIGLTSTRLYWLNRHEAFKFSGIVIAIQMFLPVLFQIGAKDVPNGLIIGQLMGQAVTLVIVYLMVLSLFPVPRRSVSMKRMNVIARRQSKFPIYTLPAALLNAGSRAIPLLFISALFTNNEAGLYVMLRKICNVPVTLLAENINKVVFQRFTKRLAHNKEVFSELKRILPWLVLASATIVAVYLIFAKANFFGLYLGEKWNGLNDIVFIMLPFLFFSFTAKAISRFSIYGRQELSLYFQITLMILTLIVFLLSEFLTLSFESTLMLYVFVSVIVFLLQISISVYLASMTNEVAAKR